jgi:hypothetical protein
MTKPAYRLVVAAVSALIIASLAAPAAVASTPQALLVAPGEPNGGFHLPKFGFSSFNIRGFGERITFVNWHGRAARLGLEPGDVILSLNGFPLTYHGSWNEALYEAVAHGGLVRLKIRDVRSGRIAFRQTYVGGGYGPVTPKYKVKGPVVHDHHDGHDHHHHDEFPGERGNVERIVKLIDRLAD